MSNKYRTIRILADLVESILKIIEKNNELGYRSHSESIIYCARRRVEDFFDLEKPKNKIS